VSPGFVPILRLCPETLLVHEGAGPGPGYREVTTAALELSFDYDGVRVRASEPSAQVRAAARCIERDLRAEADARRVLEGFGPIELGALDDCAPPPGCEADYVLDPHGDTTTLCSFRAFAIPRLQALGWRVEVDEELPCDVVVADDWFANLEPDDRGWFDLELGVEVDGQRVDLLPALLELIQTRGTIDVARGLGRMAVLPMDGRRHLVLPAERLRAVLQVLGEMYGVERMGKHGKLELPPVLPTWLTKLDDAFADAPLRWRDPGRAVDRARAMARGPAAEPPPMPPELRADLRPYQRHGVAFLQYLREQNCGGVLADDMGLGKTLQTIAHIVLEKSAGRLRMPALVVTPTSLVGNWCRELRKFAPHLRVLVLRGAERHHRRLDIPDADVVLTSYPLLVRDRAAFVGMRFHLLVTDEAQALKNVRSQVHQAVRSLDADHRVCLTGTPVENNLDELWALFDLLVPGLLGDAQTFRGVFRGPIERDGNKTRLESLRDRIAPYVLRRLKDQVASELPAKTEIVRTIELHGPQRDLYESIRLAGHAAVRQAVKQRGMKGATIDILGALMKLRQVCCDPRLVRVSTARAVQDSAKLQAVTEMIEQMTAEGRRILVFSQFATMLGLIAHELDQRRIRYTVITGATVDREKAVDAFQNGRVDVFLISLKAGGTGLNLTRADTVIHYDPWWNPAAQNQATDRAHRIGQTRPVFVYKLIVAGSVEERMLQLQRRKQSLADALLSAPGTPTAWTEGDIDDLFAPLSADTEG